MQLCEEWGHLVALKSQKKLALKGSKNLHEILQRSMTICLYVTLIYYLSFSHTY